MATDGARPFDGWRAVVDERDRLRELVRRLRRNLPLTTAQQRLYDETGDLDPPRPQSWSDPESDPLGDVLAAAEAARNAPWQPTYYPTQADVDAALRRLRGDK